MSLTTVAEVRRISGVTSTSLVSDADVNSAIAEAEAEVEKYLNASFTPKERIDVLDGNNSNTIIVMKNPLLALRELKIDGTSITIDGNIFITKQSGKLELNSAGSPEETRFKGKPQSIRIKYIHGWVEETNTQTTTDADASAGSSVVLSVGSEQGFAIKEWIEIYGMDGNKEAGKITAVASGEITIDELSFSHESGSTVVKLEVHEIIKKLMRIISGIALVARVVGESFDDITGYTLGEFHVQKGEPYTQWRETAMQLQREAKEILSRVKPRPAIF